MLIRAMMSLFRRVPQVMIADPMATTSLKSSSIETDEYLALKGQKTFRGLVDLNKDEAETVLAYLDLILRMDRDIKAMGLERHIVVAMRGGSVQYLRRDRSAFDAYDRQLVEDIARTLRLLHECGIRIEACKVAMDRFKVPADGVVDEVVVVKNTFITLIGFQQQGYGLVSIS